MYDSTPRYLIHTIKCTWYLRVRTELQTYITTKLFKNKHMVLGWQSLNETIENRDSRKIKNNFKTLCSFLCSFFQLFAERSLDRFLAHRMAFHAKTFEDGFFWISTSPFFLTMDTNLFWLIIKNVTLSVCNIIVVIDFVSNW